MLLDSSVIFEPWKERIAGAEFVCSFRFEPARKHGLTVAEATEAALYMSPRALRPPDTSSSA